VPLIRNPGAVPDDHAGCKALPCLACSAAERLTSGDWFVIEYFQAVRDQVVNQSPMGLEGGGVYLTPRLEAWIPMLDVLRVPPGEQQHVLSQARYLFEAVENRERAGSVHSIPPADLAPVALEEFRCSDP
jgi:hypothetical protein